MCLAESNAGDTGTAIKWAQQLGESPSARFAGRLGELGDAADGRSAGHAGLFQ